MRTDEQPIRISLFAPKGRMGKAIAAAAAEDPGFEIDQDHGDVLIDFSAPSALQASLDRAMAAGVPILVGTTGLDDFAGSAWPCSPIWSSARLRFSDRRGTSRLWKCTIG